jgi:hypothetical protein
MDCEIGGAFFSCSIIQSVFIIISIGVTVNGMRTVEIVSKVIPNLKLEREILGFGESIKVLAPEHLRHRINKRLSKAIKNYKTEI